MTHAPVADVLKSIERQGNFIFSYNSNLLKADSFVSLHIEQKTVAEALQQLFGQRYRYQQNQQHLIMLPAAKIPADNWYVSGFVLDKATGAPIAFASIYEPTQLVGTMTDENGYFSLQLKSQHTTPAISVRKISYADTIVQVYSGSENKLEIGITQIAYPIDTVVISNSVERNWLARRLLSPRQVMNSMNLSGFFTRQPFQFSLVPGLGSHGRMGAQVVNKFSLNIFGGYTAGVNGFELGSLFNIVKQDMQYVQVGGLFNIVGGRVNGLQVGGLYNSVRNGVEGLQIGGLINIVHAEVNGLQIGGLYNQAAHAKGIRIAGIGNFNKRNSNGLEIGGLFNHTKTMRGVQIAGLLNSNRKFSGFQVAVVNVADTNLGYSIGLVNISKSGYHKVALSFDETQTLMLSYKSGNPRMYSVLGLGTQLNPQEKAYAIGYGLGSDLPVYRQRLFFNPELVHYFFYNGNWARQNMLDRLSLNLKYRISKNIAVYGGPSFNIGYDKPAAVPDGYKETLFNGGFRLSDRVKGWIGWTIGIDVF